MSEETLRGAWEKTFGGNTARRGGKAMLQQVMWATSMVDIMDIALEEHLGTLGDMPHLVPEISAKPDKTTLEEVMAAWSIVSVSQTLCNKWRDMEPIAEWLEHVEEVKGEQHLYYTDRKNELEKCAGWIYYTLDGILCRYRSNNLIGKDIGILQERVNKWYDALDKYLKKLPGALDGLDPSVERPTD